MHVLSPDHDLDAGAVTDGVRCLKEHNFQHATLVHDPIPWTKCKESKLPPRHASVSDRALWLRQEIQLVSCADPAQEVFKYHDGESVTFYHGTTALVAWLLLSSGGFIPGPNGHSKGKKHFKGCFGSTDFDTAKCRGDQTRNLGDDGIYTFANCPVVLELKAEVAIIKNYKPGHPHLIVVPGETGALLPGVSVKVLHWNERFVANYKALYNPWVRAQIRQAGGVFQLCCELGRQRQDFQSCGDTRTSTFVNYGQYKCCQRCRDLWTAE